LNDIFEKLKTRGYWEVSIRPTEFMDNRIESLAKSKEIVRELSVQFRGWDYPHFDTNNPPTSGIDYVEQSLDWQDKIEFWRYYQSGQFIHYFGMWEDWQDQSTIWSYKPISKPGEILSIIGAVYRFTEIYEFASRLALRGYLGKTCKLSISLYGTKGRRLIMLEPGRLLSADYRSSLDVIPYNISITTENLIGKSAELALDHVVWVFQRFNWDYVPRAVLQEDQTKFIERRV
jgi:hypothetical protein